MAPTAPRRAQPRAPLPVDAAGAALVRAIERRSRRVILPRAAYPAVMAARLIRPLLDRRYARVTEQLLVEEQRSGPTGETLPVR